MRWERLLLSSRPMNMGVVQIPDWEINPHVVAVGAQTFLIVHETVADNDKLL